MESRGIRGGGVDYRPEEWRERGIRARRFRCCPHCGAAVSARERVWTPRSGGSTMIFREARCKGEGCGWRYVKHDGSRDDFVAAVNRRATKDDNG